MVSVYAIRDGYPVHNASVRRCDSSYILFDLFRAGPIHDPGLWKN